MQQNCAEKSEKRNNSPVKLCTKCGEPGQFYVRRGKEATRCTLCERGAILVSEHNKTGRPLPDHLQGEIPKALPLPSELKAKRPKSEFFQTLDWLSVLIGDELYEN